jgi:hypothetical protein
MKNGLSPAIINDLHDVNDAVVPTVLGNLARQTRRTAPAPSRRSTALPHCRTAPDIQLAVSGSCGLFNGRRHRPRNSNNGNSLVGG